MLQFPLMIYLLGILGVLGCHIIKTPHWTYALSQLSLGIVFGVTVCCSSILFSGIILCAMFALAYSKENQRVFAHLHSMKTWDQYYVLQLISTFGVLTMVLSSHWLEQYIGLEIAFLPLYAMLIKQSDEGSLSVQMQYIITSVVFSIILLYGLSLSYGWILFQYPSFRRIGMMCILMSMSFKLGLLPFHGWMPRVYQHAHIAPLFFLHTIPKIGIIYMLCQCMSLYGDHVVRYTLIFFAVLSIIFGNLKASVEPKTRLFLAYSGMAHMGYIALGIAVGGENLSYHALLMFYIISYAWISLLFFKMLATIPYNNAYIEDNKEMALSSNQGNGVIYAALFSLFSMLGIPLSAGFFPKLGLLHVLMQQQWLSLACLIVMASVFSAYYYVRLIRSICTNQNKLTVLNQNMSLFFVIHIGILLLLSFFSIF